MSSNKLAKKIRYALRFMPDAMYIQLNYFAHFKKFANLKKPGTYNEKLNWLKIHDRNPLYTTLVDKYEVKKYLLHVTTTPSVAYIARVDDFDCGIMISASHNPYYDNGIKLIDGYGEKMPEETLLLIEAYIDGKLHVLSVGSVRKGQRQNHG